MKYTDRNQRIIEAAERLGMSPKSIYTRMALGWSFERAITEPKKPRAIPSSHRSGDSRSKTYNSWRSMKMRCLSPTCKRFRDWGGRGIKICDRWMEFKNFLADMGECPDGMTIDRKDNDGHYEPSNCRWATAIEQRRNRRDYLHDHRTED